MDELADYIDQARHRGYEDDEIRDSLVGGGWNAEQVSAKLTELPPPELPTHVSSSPSLPAENAPYLQPENYAAATEQAQAEIQAQAAPAPVVTVTTPVFQPAVGQPVVEQQSFQPFEATTPLVGHRSLLKIMLVTAVVVVVAFVSYSLFAPKTSYQTVVDQVIHAVQKNDRKTLDALESPASKQYYQKSTGSSGFYAACHDAGELCTAFFKPAYLAKATKTLKNYTAANGKKGKEVVYTIKETTTGNGCKSVSTGVISIAVVPKDRSWQFDKIGENVDFSVDGCVVN